MVREFVVARYNEDERRWLDVSMTCDVALYDKGRPSILTKSVVLPNVGREAHTYMWHVVERHGSGLADETFFSQCDPEPHSRGFMSMCSSVKLVSDFVEFGDNVLVNDLAGRPDHPHGRIGLLDIGRIWSELFVTEPPKLLRVRAGAIFAVRRKRIELLPRSFYERCLALSSTGYAPWEFERLWPSIFTVDVGYIKK